MARQLLHFDVFGRRIDVERAQGRWTAYIPGNDGKRRPANIAFPPHLDADAVEQYLDDLFHESASPAHPMVRRL